MRLRTMLLPALLLAATWTLAQQSSLGGQVSASASSDSTSGSLAMQGCLGTSFQGGNYTLTNAQTATVYTLVGSDDLTAYVGKQVEITGELVMESSNPGTSSSQLDQSGAMSSNSQPGAATGTDGPNPGATVDDSQTLHVRKVTMIANHCLVGAGKPSSSPRRQLKFMAFKGGAQTSSSPASGSSQASTPGQASPGQTGTPSTPPANPSPNNPPSTATPQGSTATPQGSAATPQGSTATPQGSTATPQGSTATPQGSTATPQGSTATPDGGATGTPNSTTPPTPCAGTGSASPNNTNCGNPNTNPPGSTSGATPAQGTPKTTPQSTPAPQTTPDSGTVPPKAQA